MNRLVLMTLVFVLGVSFGAFAAKVKLDSSVFLGKEKEVAGSALLDVARSMVGPKHSWENIAIGRVLYLSGDKEAGEKIFEAVTGRKENGSDYMRIGRAYVEAGDWEKATHAFNRALQLSPDDAPWMAEIGAHYLIAGDRAMAEKLFRESVRIESDNFWSIVSMAAGYYGVRPQ